MRVMHPSARCAYVWSYKVRPETRNRESDRLTARSDSHLLLLFIQPTFIQEEINALQRTIGQYHDQATGR